MKKSIISLFVLLALLSISFESMAWGGFGHRSIAELAERNLTPEAKANIEKYTHGTPLADYSTWMDAIRKDDEHHRIATRGWHASIVDAECHTSQALRDKYRKGRDSVTGLLELEELLKDREKLDDSVVMFAIKCIVHMVGDMHCPAHVRFTDNENQGKFPIKFYGKNTTLHKVWDTSVLTRYHKGWSYQQYADKLDTFNARQKKRATAGWVEEWLEDAARSVRPATYWVSKGDSLGEEFQSQGYPLAEELVRKAGYRLAKVLNTFFK